MLHDGLGAPPRCHAAAARRRHADVAPHILALLQCAQRGNRDAFADLCTAFREPVTRYICVRMRDHDPDAIPDLVQQTFTDALADLSTALLDVRGWSILHAAKACNQHDWLVRTTATVDISQRA